MKDLSPVFEYSSIIEVAMGLGAILFVGEAVMKPEDSEKGNETQPLTGSERVIQDLLEAEFQHPVMKDQESLPELRGA